MDRRLSYSVRHGVVLAGLLLHSCLPCQAQSLMTVRRAVHQDVSAPLRDLIKQAPPAALAKREAEPVRRIPLPQGFAPLAEDPVRQRTVGPATPAISTSFEGLGRGQYGFLVTSAPPDTNGAVGTTQYVQWVNTSFAIFDKARRAKIAGPTAGNTLWAGFGGGCAINNDGDPIVLFDKAAQRWVFSQFSVSTTPFLQCIAVSTTSDATGTYHRYSFRYNNVDDYPKMGVWPDAYYETFNMFNGVTGIFVGADVCAYNRTAMLAGAAATQICFQQGASVGGLLPSDFDGSTAPPAGSPNYMIFFGANNLHLYKFHVDFATPINSTFTGPTVIPVAAFTPLCNGGACIPQPGTTQKLDSLADRLMYRLAYRNFGTHESLVVNHSVAVNGGGGGVRWYEIQNPSGTPVVAQQGTFAPDSSFRWMGSIAMDHAGDIALGYSVSSNSINPSVRYAGRVATDPAGTMEAEVNVVTGTGSQNGSLNRWGDYSAMKVDPVDDCTFWYTQEYMKTTGSFNWNTRIATFKFSNCSSSGPAVLLSTAKLSFPKTVIGRTSPARTVTLTNTGNAVLNISRVTVTGDFTISANTCGAHVAAAASCKISLTFTPTTKGAHAGTLSLNDSAPGSPQTVALSGVGTQIALSLTALNFATITVGQTSPSQTVTVTNVGTTVVTFSSFSIGGANPGDYLITKNTCGATLVGGTGCAVSVAFKPTVTGTRKATLQVADNGGGSPQTATLTGIGG